MTEHFTEYELATGRLGGTFSIRPSEASLQALAAGRALLPGRFAAASQYVRETLNGPEVFARPDMDPAFDKTRIAADGIEIITLSNLPDPCRIVYAGPGFAEEGEVSGGSVEFTTDASGTHTVTVSAWPYLDWEGGFDAL